MGQSLSVLIVEDSERDALLLVRELQRGGYDVDHERVDSESGMAAAIAKRSWDIVLADYSMPQFNASAALALIAKSHVDIPCIVVSGSVGEETVVEVMRAGAQDLVLKHKLKRLLPSISRELKAARTRQERRAADAKVDRERQLLRQLMQGIPDAICFKDAQRRYTRLNDAERAILQVEREGDAIGKTADELLPAELGPKRRKDEERILSTGEALIDCVETINAPTGETRWISATKAPIRSAAGEIIGIVEIARDITEAKRQEQLKNEFIATVSHELRTPITSITASVAFLASGAVGRLPTPATRMLKVADSNCRRLVRVVNDILDMEKIESGRMTYDKKPVDMLAVVDQAIAASRPTADECGVAILLNLRAKSTIVLGDADRLSQVINNLLSNGIKFSPPQSEIAVTIENRDGEVRVSVRDLGPGIPEDYKHRIFEKFVQVDASDNRQKSGTGLGLSIAKQIVDSLGGKIGFEAAPGGGTVFFVSFLEQQECRETGYVRSSPSDEPQNLAPMERAAI